MRKLPLAPVLISAVFCLGGFAIGRQGSTPSEDPAMSLSMALSSQSLRDYLTSIGDKTDYSSEPLPNIASLFDKVASDPALASRFASLTISESSAVAIPGRPATTDSPLRLQALAVAQNAKIISLLTKLVNAKK